MSTCAEKVATIDQVIRNLEVADTLLADANTCVKLAACGDASSYAKASQLIERARAHISGPAEARVVPMDVLRDVGEFHAKFNLPVTGTARLGLMSFADFKYRTAFLFEELREFIECHASGDVAQAGDALADLIWVAAGTAHYMGLPLDRIWAEVRRANLEKRPWRDGDPVKPRNTGNTSGEIVKPEGWRPPDVHGVVTAFAAEQRARR